MKFITAGLASLAGAGAFVPPSRPTNTHRPAVTASSSITSSSTTLYQFGTLGFDTTNLYSREEEENMDKLNNVMQYLSEVKAPTAVRSDLGTSVLVSGFNPEDPSSTEILAFLNDEESPHFQFTNIVAHVDDVKLAKKRLIGRNARYTGLLDKLTFSEGASLPTTDQLADVSSWVAHVGKGDMSKLVNIVTAAEASDSVKHVVILVSGAQHVEGGAMKEAEEMLKDKATNFAYTLLVVPEWNNDPEAICAFGIVNITDVADAPFGNGETFSREESLRLISECLAIDKAAGKCVVANAAKEANSLENMLIQGMREIGFDRLEEIEHMVTRGAKGYNDLMAAEEEDTPWEEAKEDSEEEKAAKAKSNQESVDLGREKRAEAAKQVDLKEMATQWAKREYLRKSMKRAVPVKEDAFIEIIWDRAMFEADLKYRTMQGQAVSESEERKKFREDQQKKKEEAYRSEKERWKKMKYSELDSAKK